MKFYMFRRIAALVILACVLGGSCLCYRSCSSAPAATVSTAAPQAAPQQAQQRAAYVPPVQQEYVAPPVQQAAYVATPVPRQQLAMSDVKAMVDDFLAHHGKNNGRDKWVDCIPNAPFRATAVKFNNGNHAQYSSKDQTLWSQIKLDLNRDGQDDEKWLLKDGKTYKREVCADASCKTTVGSPTFF